MIEAGQGPCISNEDYARLARQAKEPVSTLFEDFGDSVYAWPLANALGDGLILVNYVDDDYVVNGSLTDYMGYQHTYDGHRGTDLTLYNFRAMDRGIPVLAAADGSVSSIADGNFDRNTSASNMPANYIRVNSSTGSAFYYHLRKNSTAVLLGETVQKGQLLGLVGSSGSSTDAHLHFENVGTRDPWSGPNNPLPSLWEHQVDYVGNDPLRIYDLGIMTDAVASNRPSSSFASLLKERPSQPMLFGASEDTIWVWMLIQGQAGDPYDVEIRRPDGSLFAAVSNALGAKIRYGWLIIPLSISPPIDPSQFGSWIVRVFTAGTLAKALDFQVGETTYFAPRFWPIAGRSWHLGGTQTYHDTLRVSSFGRPVSYSLKDPPSFVSLDEDSIVTIYQPTTHWSRNRFFQAIATDSLGLQDTMWYHLVDFMGSVVAGIPSDRAADNRVGVSAAIAPNPLNPGGVLTVRTGRPGRLKVGLFDISGRLVRTILDETAAPSGTRKIPIEGRGADGGELPSGIYFYRIETSGGVLPGRFVLLK